MPQKGNSMSYKEFISDPDNLFLIECWARDGMTKNQIADNIGITPQTLSKWQAKHEEFAAAIKIGAEITDYRVENALLKKALGYDYDEVKTIVGFPDENGNRPIKTETTRKHVPPDVNAMLLWLNNRRPDKWKRNNDTFTLLDEATADGSNITINVVKAKPKGEERFNGGKQNAARKKKEEAERAASD